MPEKRIQFSNIVQNQVPSYVKEEFPLISEFLKSYYIAQEFDGAPIDLIENIDRYTKINNLTNLVDSVVLKTDLGFDDETVEVDLTKSPTGTDGFPSTYGLLKIDDEIITYTGKTDSAFTGCVRGFSGITSYKADAKSDELVFKQTTAAEHDAESTISNLSILFLNEFLLKTKHQLTPGLEDRTLHVDVDQNIFIKQAKDFYLSKGTDKSFEILFKALYDEEVRIVRPKDFLFTPSNANYRITNDLVVEAIPDGGDPMDLEQATLFQFPYEQNTNKAYAPITSVEKISTGLGQTYYKMSVDAGYNRDVRVDGAIYGNFTVQPSTKLIGQVSAGATVLDVDSTVGFGSTGELFLTYADNTTGVVSYTSKSLTQFFGVDDIIGTVPNASVVGINTFAFGSSFSDQDETVLVRINSVLSNLDYPSDTYTYSSGDTAKIKTLGIGATSFKAKNWFYNIAPIYKVESVTLQDSSDNTYEVKLYVDHYFRIGDPASIIDSNDVTRSTTIVNVLSSTSVLIRGQGNLPAETYTLRKDISKAQSNTFPGVNIYSTNVQNVYVDDDKLLVATPSLPSYASQPLDVSTQKITFSGTYAEGATEFEILTTGDTGFYTGDMIYYTPQKVEEEYFNSNGTKTTRLVVKSSFFPADVGFVCLKDITDTSETELIPDGQKLYFVKRINKTTIQLAESRDNIYNSNFITLTATAVLTDNLIQPYKFRDKTLESQRLLREVDLPSNDGTVTSTEPGFTGILVNGVEILNYKSNDVLYYGKVNSIEVSAPGSDYDISNPPQLLIKDAVGTGATGYPAVSGNLRQIRVLDSGFDYQETPVVTITGGNGKGAVASVNMKQITHSMDFDSEAVSGKVSLGATQSTIGFSTFHKFQTAEQVFYITGGQQNIGGITTDSPYYVSLVGLTTVKLHTTEGDAIAGINTVTLSSYGKGKQTLQSYFRKSVVDSVNVINSGSGYQNKKRTAGISGISTSYNRITITNHDYASGDVIKYTETTGTAVGGLSTGTEYYVTSVDADKFKLSAVGVTSDKEYYYRTKQYVDLTSVGVGTHIFDYPDLSVTLTGKVGIASTGLETFEAQLQPIFRGEVTSIHLSNQGVGYGSSEVLNFVRDPEVSLVGGDEAQLTPIVVDGGISEVVVLNAGQKYNSAPDLLITGDGQGAVITPVFENNQITSVKVINGGTGYTQAATTVTVLFPGSNVKFRPLLQTWRVNLFERNFDEFKGDDGYIAHEFNKNRGLQYSHLYAPRKLREVMFATDQTGVTLYGDKDLKRVSSLEVASDQHSPIIGWAYDGNPIYGPYGYITKSGGIVSQMRSGYSLNIPSGRPSTSIWAEGFFIEDYTYNDVVDETVLDENNGRFCVTPEYPQGTYAYFATINSSSPDSSGPFSGYKRPTFPYLVGDNYYSLPNDFNFAHNADQDSIKLEDSAWLRNTKPYNLIEGSLNYQYAFIPNDLKQTIDVKGVSPGGLTNIGIETGGDLYQVDDPIVFDSTNTQGFGAAAKVSKLGGKTVSSVSVAQSTITGVELYTADTKGTFIAFSENPHNFKNKDLIEISGLSTTSSEIGGHYNVGVVTNRFIVTGVGTTSSGIGTVEATGVVTHFSVTGDLTYPAISPNDILGIGTERVRVLNIEPHLSRIRVLRTVDGTVGGSHTVTSVLYPDQRKLTFDAGIKTTYNIRRNEQLYFNPSEAVGLGTTAGVGVGSTLSFSNPGTGLTELFIPTKAIYIPGHGLKTGDQLTYYLGDGDGIQYWENATSGVGTLADGETVYAGVINPNMIGISTVRVGLASTGSFVGIASTVQSSTTLFFSGVGTGVYHSFKTNFSPITASLTRNQVTVSTGSTHGLINDDLVDVNVNPENTGFVTVKYNDYNRKVLIDAQAFTASGVNTTTNTFTITEHGFVGGQKVVYTSSSPIEGLTNDGIYYVVKLSDSEFKLADNYYQSVALIPNTLGITSASAGTFSPINPPLKVYKNSSVEFDVSDSSLGYTVQSTDYPAFELNFYRDQNFTELWDKGLSNKDFQVVRAGQVGSSGATVTLTVNENAPDILHYKLDSLYESDLPVVKEEVNVDTEVVSNNEVEISESLYNGTQSITASATNAFTYTIPEYPEAVSYAATTSNLTYDTFSTNAYGPITDFEIKNKGTNYYSLPGITTITTSVGKGAIIEAKSTSIGKVVRTEIQDIGYNFPSDTTLRPTVELPQLIDIEALASFGFIGISSGGRGYSAAPDLKVLDGKTNKVIDDVDLKYTLGDSNVTILKNTTGMSNVTPTILPIHNSNGVGISTVGFNTITKDVTLTMSVGFSTLGGFPFAVNDKILVENISVGVGTTGVGYNSVDYDYELFTVTAVDENYGGIGTITYNIDGVLGGKPTGSIPGTFDEANSAGRVIPQKYFPIFDIDLAFNHYFTGETVKSNSATGVVESWNPQSGLLKISSGEEFVINETIRGESSNTQGIASSITTFSSELEFGPTSKVLHGWETNSGWLSYNLQRLQDSLYYQRFAYALRSKVSYDTWDDVVSTLNHSLGFKKFSDYQLESKSETSVGLTTNQTSIDIVSDLIGFGNLNCVYDFDLVKENSLTIGSNTVSDEIIFSSRILSDYYESVGNRVLSIDDFSGSFNSNPRPTDYSVVDTFDLSTVRSNKYFCYIRDKRYTQERQLMIVDLLHDGSFGYINQYGRVDTVYDQGSFDFLISGTEGQLQYYPTKSSVNDYWVTTLSWNIEDSFVGVGTTTFGDVVVIDSDSVEIPASTTTNVVSIAHTYRSLKILANVTADTTGTDNEFDFVELNILHDGTNVSMLEYGNLTTQNSSFSGTGLGTFYPYISGSTLKVDFVPNAGIGTTGVVNTIQVGFASETSSGIGTQDLNHVRLEAKATSISASGTPIFVPVGEYPDTYDSAYFIAQVSDTTNDLYQTSEILVVDNYVEDSTITVQTYDTEYAILQTDSSLGIFSTGVSGFGTSYLYFQPNASIACEVKVFMTALYHPDEPGAANEIDFTNSYIRSAFGSYTGTDRDIKRAFGMEHKTNPIFERYFTGNDSTIVNVTDNTITIPDHFWVTGEKLKYKHVGSATSAVGIASTSFVGVGTTSYLPENPFVIKIDADTIKLARSAEDALKTVPLALDITSVGIGTSHRFVSTNQNAKAVVALDNIIQAPVVSTAITTVLADQIFDTTNVIPFSGITSFFGADLVRVGTGNTTEIMKIESVGVGGTNNIRVRRGWLGTRIAGFGTDALVTKVIGNYNIVDNVLNFTEAPYGLTPLSSTSNQPDDRDWVGISTSSTFQGRTFMRSGINDTSNETYYKNYVFDSIHGFDGITRDYTLQADGSNVTGIKTESFLLINDVYQASGSDYQYTIEEGSGISTVSWVGTATSLASDPGGSNIPLGGVIVSVGSSEGFGYQPLISAGGTAIVSSAGTVSSISIGSSGSGYRTGVVSAINVAIKTESMGIPNLTPIGTATASGGYVTGIAVTNAHVFAPPRTISNVGYNSVTGVTTVTTHKAHGYSLGDEVELSGIAFTCTYAPPFDITAVGYNTASGIMTVTTSGANGFAVGRDVIFTGMGFTCDIDAGISTHYYPRGGDPAYNTAISIAATTATTITVDVGYASPNNQFSHTFVGIGTSAVISGGDYAHQFVSAGTSAVVTGGAYTHTFVSAVGGGVTITGIGSTTPTDATYDPSTGDMVLTVGSGHTYTTSNTVGIDTNALTFTCSMDNNKSNHSYPRPSDPIISMGTTAITSTGDDTITINIGASPFVYYTPSDVTYTPSTGEMVLTIGSHSLTGPSTHTVNSAEYNPVTGIMTVYTTVGSANSFSSGDKIRFDDDSLSFICDYGSGTKTYPRSGTGINTTDPMSGRWKPISGIGSTSFEVQVLDSAPSTNTGVHTFVSAIAGGLLKMGESVQVESDSLTFRCAMDNYSSLHTYPRSTDPGFSTSLGITSTTATTITLNVGVSTLVNHTVTAANYSANTGILTMTIGAHTLTTGESIKLKEEGLTFSCSKDSNSTYHRYPRRPDPTYGGTPVTTVNSTTQFEVNVGTSTVVSYFTGSGTVQGSIVAPRTSNNSTSKQDPAAKEVTVLEVLDNKKFIVNTGTSTCPHFYARGGSVQPHLEVVIDDPLSYSNIPLVYADGSSGVGTEATIDIVVGQGSSVVDFRIDETGYGYGQGESLTVGIGGTVGIPTTSGYKEFLINIDETFSDEFTGWSLGFLHMLDNLDNKFDGSTVSFTLTENSGDVVSIRAGKGSNIDVQDVLLIFINDILQVPGQGYKFTGGSVIEFTEAPKVGDTSKIVFYKGSGDTDVVFKDVVETVKEGDDLTIEHGEEAPWLQEDARNVILINSTDLVTTNPYYGPGNTGDETMTRPVKWCRQTEDKIINEKEVGKDRDLYEPRIYPYAYITKTVGIGSTTIYVDTLRPIFDAQNENVDSDALSFQKKVIFMDQDTRTAAAATAIVSGLGTISSIDVTSGGAGYSTATLSIGSTVQGGAGIGTTTTAFGTVTIANGVITGAAITNPGYGYTTDSPPSVLISPPIYTEEANNVNTYAGDQGEIVGFGTTTISGGTQFIFDLMIPEDSFLRNSTITGTAVTISGIGTNDYFVVKYSNVGIATTSITSLNAGGGTVGVGTNFVDNVYEVNDSEIVYTPTGLDSNGVGIGTSHINRVFVKIDGSFTYDTVGIDTSNFFGSYSWGRIDLTSRSGLNSYTAYTQSGIGYTDGAGISTSMIVQRTNRLKSKNYAT